ncbi:Asp23/Gls24 family envelope stress response protein [Planomonospora corallina]|uniref:Asp23/Gls24 family envelope stress response protein n=1 Tax=Planomonospora corallina TaxID=1806052 RepID=A0ABV8IBH7_9ACTN
MTDVSVEELVDEAAETAEETAVEGTGETGRSPEPSAGAGAAVRPFSLGASVAPAPQVPSAPAAPSVPAASEGVAAAVVKGRITVADEVVEKVAALATLEVAGVAGLGTDPGRLAEAVRERAAGRFRGVSAHVQDRTVAVDVAIVAEYGHVVMDVAGEVKTNVARTVSRMLGMRVVEVNVTVDDVRLPGETGPEAAGV